MEISKECKNFWQILELEGMCMPAHIKNILCINGYTSAAIISKIDEKIVVEIEQFVREDMLTVLESLCTQQNRQFGENVRNSFFGRHHENPADFKFTDEEKQRIMDLRHHTMKTSNTSEITTALEQLSLDEERVDSHWYFEDIEETSHTSTQNEKGYEENTPTHAILKKLLENANRNCHRVPAGYRFDHDVKEWAAFVRMLAGPLGYSAIQENLPLALPSLSSLNHYIQNTKVIKEGVLRPYELELYLKQRNLPLTVTISEDATRIQGRVQYDSRNNEVVGLVLPINSANGLPIPSVFKARNTKEIISHFTSEIPTASFVNTIMVQPIAKIPPFCLLIFGTDCRFTSSDVSGRWKHIVAELKKINIEVLTVASDSDPKFNCAMRKNSNLGHSSNIFNSEWFRCGDNIEPPFYIQDTTHIGTKLRNFFLKTLTNPDMIPFGDKYFVRFEHIKRIIDTIGKDKHQLTQSVLDTNDRQNFDSVLKICDPRVSALLENHVSDSLATAKVLEMTRNIIASFMDPSIDPLERVFKIWHSLFFIRLWRQFVISNKSLTLKNNFLTNYCYICIELNAHSLILILLYLRRVDKPNLFMPLVYSSQPCESFYRQIRSFTSTYSTVANCTVKEILERINKIQLQNDISSDKNSLFKFPQKLKSCELQTQNPINQLPSKSDIIKTIEKAKKIAINDAITIGLVQKKGLVMSLKCEVTPYNSVEHSIERTYKKKNQAATDSILSELPSVSLKNYAHLFKNEICIDTSPYVEIFGGPKRKIVKKTSLCWFLGKKEVKLSSDRLKRVQNVKLKKQRNKSNKKTKLKHLFFADLFKQ